MKRPTIALCMIVKNEADNLPVLFESIKDCFDEIHITDTGSTDNTIEVAKSLGAIVHNFEWVNDFAEARNYSFSHATTDYICWFDGDDSLVNRQAFIDWRDNVMCTSDYWLAKYNYGPGCEFDRERVIKRVLGVKWKYFVHEGIIPDENLGQKVTANYCFTWSVKHRRAEVDIEKDRSRNLKMFEGRIETLDPRMKYYYGKELFEAQQPEKAIPWLMDAIMDKKIELHDRVLGVQYACYSFMQTNKFDEAINTALQGLHLIPQRAEYFCLIGDCLVKKFRPADAIPFYVAAKNCINTTSNGMITGPIFTYGEAYGPYPRNQLARIYVQTEQYERAEEEIKECLKLYPENPEVIMISEEFEKVKATMKINPNLVENEDIVITCPGQSLYEFDPGVERSKGIGGSETAVVYMAKHLKDITKKRVVVFNHRKEDAVFDGVEYISNEKMGEYFKNNRPKVNIAWRYSAKITQAPTYVWCHDLLAPNLHMQDNYEKVMCLSEFHKKYVHSMIGLPNEKILVTRNGIEPSKFSDQVFQKKKGKVIFSSSPDRGLDMAIRVMDEVVKVIPEAELHVFYGFDNMRKMGLDADIEKIEAMIYTRKWIKFKGNTQQNELMKEMQSSEVWLYPTNFNETFCITALEMLANKVYPIARSVGALQNTLADACSKGQASLLDDVCETDEAIAKYAEQVISAINEEKWKNVDLPIEHHDWKAVAHEWVEFMGLK